MKRLRLLILVFILALTVPLGYLVHRTQRSLEQEETGQLRFFANTLFDQMEQELAALVQREEQRPVDEYLASAPDGGERSPEVAAEPYILGYLQNNPDGSFTTPPAAPEAGRAAAVQRLEEVNRIFNIKRTAPPEERQAGAAAPKKPEEKELAAAKGESSSFADKYLDFSRSAKQKAQLGQAEKRVEQISPQQAMNLAQNDEAKDAGGERPQAGRSTGLLQSRESRVAAAPSPALRATAPAPRVALESPPTREQSSAPGSLSPAEGLRAEVDPLQSVQIDEGLVLLFRRVVIGNQVYRQGVVIRVEALLQALKDKYFNGQPIARFATLTLTATSGGHESSRVQEGPEILEARFALERTFPRPFAFVRASLTSADIPRSPGHTTLYVMVAATAAVILLGLLAIYQSARVVAELSERRSGFVSSVTHELKTPLTNIRMYIEMLEQGIASDPERELEYYRIVESESARLSRLINNVLEFSKLEKRQRRLDYAEGDLSEVLGEVRDAVHEWLRQEGFTLTVENHLDQPFRYDREVMVQLLMNLIENSVKFGRNAPRREISVAVRPEGDRVVVRVSDTGPGIARHALKKVFDDFYRVDDALTRTTKGTGIGLALVKRFVQAMDGTVSAANNDGPGCTISLSLPAALPVADGRSQAPSLE